MILKQFDKDTDCKYNYSLEIFYIYSDNISEIFPFSEFNICKGVLHEKGLKSLCKSFSAFCSCDSGIQPAEFKECRDVFDR